MPSQKALIIDDDGFMLSCLVAIFEHDRWSVASTTDHKKAIEIAQGFQPDVILLDVNLGDGVSGYDVADALKESGSLAPVVFITSDMSDEFRENAFKHGAIDFYTKPFDPDELLEHTRPIARLGRLNRIINSLLDKGSNHANEDHSATKADQADITKAQDY